MTILRRISLFILTATLLLLSSGCASLGEYFQDRALDFVDCFKLDVGLIGGVAEAHVRITDAFVTGIGAGVALKIGFKGRHVGGWMDMHLGLPFLPICWFSSEDDVCREFPITYYGLTGNKAIWCMSGTVDCIPGSYETESILAYPITFEKSPERGPFIALPKNMADNNLTNEEQKYARTRPQKKPFSNDLLHSFDIEAGGTLGFILCASVHVGFSPGEFADFLLGWFGVDIGEDDYRSIGEKIRKTALGLKDENEDIHRKTVKELDEFRDKRALEPLLQALQDNSSDISESAARALGNIRDARAVPPLVRALRDEEMKVRGSAGKALEEIGEPAIEPLINLLENNSYDVEDVLSGIGGPAVEPLIEVLKHKNKNVRIKALIILRQINDARIVQPMILMLRDNEPDIRSRTANMLGWIGGKRAIPPLIQALKDENADVRENAAWSLQWITKKDFGTDYDKWNKWYGR
jgi:hypothetical protein